MNQIVQFMSGPSSWIALLTAVWCLYRSVVFHKNAMKYHKEAQEFHRAATMRYQETAAKESAYHERQLVLDDVRQANEEMETERQRRMQLYRGRRSVRHPKKRETKVLRKPTRPLPKYLANQAKMEPVLYGRILTGF